MFAAFDSIEARINLIKTLAEKKSKVEYLIDTRYDDLTASVFVINMKDQEQLDYYMNGLEADAKAFEKENEKNKIKDEKDFIKYLEQCNAFTNNCGSTKTELVKLVTNINHPPSSIIDSEIPCPSSTNIDDNCKGTKCQASFIAFYNKHKEILNNSLELKKESSCIRQNFIDIYHYASSFVFAAIREIESGKEKPFTHIDVTTDPLPKSLLLRK